MIHTVQAGDTLFSIAKQYQTTVGQLKELNQLLSNSIYIGQKIVVATNGTVTSDATTANQLQTYSVQAGDTLYRIALRFNTTTIQLQEWNQLDNTFLEVGQKLIVAMPNGSISPPDTPPPSSAPKPNPAPATPTNSEEEWLTYSVQPGDSLYKLAQRFRTTVAQLQKTNQLDGAAIFVGQALLVPKKGGHSNSNTNLPPVDIEQEETIYTVKKGDTLTVIAWIFDVSVAELKQWNELNSDHLRIGQQLNILKGNTDSTNPSASPKEEPVVTPSEATPITYIVNLGDSLWSIAQKFNTSVDELKQWNKLSSNDISLGQKLIVGIQHGSDHIDPSQNEQLIFTFQHALTGSVGASGKNALKDVQKVQLQLYKAGFLSAKDYEAEKANRSNLSPNELYQTIIAIQQLEKTVLPNRTPKGTLQPNSEAWMFLSNWQFASNNEVIQQIHQTRKDFHLTYINGEIWFEEPLSGPIGKTNYGNYIEDVTKLQKRLIEIGYLNVEHARAEQERLDEEERNSPNKIAHTIQALIKFQKNLVQYWHKYPEKVDGVNQYLHGVVQQGDLTHKILKEYTHYRISFPKINKPNSRVTVTFTNYPKGWITEDVHGIFYKGHIEPNVLPLQAYRKMGLSTVEAKALKYVSEHEGNFDAINTYDKGIFSYGFIQFAGGTSGLSPMMALMKHRKPAVFDRYFGRYGVDVAYAITRGEIRYAHLLVTDVERGRLLRGYEAELYLKENVLMAGLFIHAAYDSEVQKSQVESAKRRYVIPALNIRLNFELRVIHVLHSNRTLIRERYVGKRADAYARTAAYRQKRDARLIRDQQLSVIDVPLMQLVRSEMGITVMIDLTVNQWIHATRDYFTDAIKNIAANDQLDTLKKLKGISDWKVLNEITKMGNTLASVRTKNILKNSGLSTKK